MEVKHQTVPFYLSKLESHVWQPQAAIWRLLDGNTWPHPPCLGCFHLSSSYARLHSLLLSNSVGIINRDARLNLSHPCMLCEEKSQPSIVAFNYPSRYEPVHMKQKRRLRFHLDFYLLVEGSRGFPLLGFEWSHSFSIFIVCKCSIYSHVY